MADPCVHCGRAPTGLDHVVALTRDGHDGWINRAPACGRCDNLKGNASLLMYLWACEKARQRVARRPQRYNGNVEIARNAVFTMASTWLRQLKLRR